MEIQEELASKLENVLAAVPSAVRLVVAGMPFEFGTAKLARVFPHNIIERLALRSGQLAPDGTPLLRVEQDIFAVRAIYAFYLNGAIIQPASDLDLEALAAACDYLGTTELIEQIARLREAVAETAPPPATRDELGAPAGGLAAEESDEFIYLTEPSAAHTEADFMIVRPACPLTPEDRALLACGSRLRVAIGRGEDPDIPLVDLCPRPGTICLDRNDGRRAKLPYTVVRAAASARANRPRRWVESLAEFEANLQALSYGVLDATMPEALVVAGGAVLRCMTKVPLPDKKTTKAFQRALDLIAGDDEPVTLTEVAQAAARVDLFGRHDAPALEPEAFDWAARLFGAHAPALNIHPSWRHRHNGQTIAPALVSFVKKRRHDPGAGGDIDLFVTSPDPKTVLAAVSDIHARMVKIHRDVAIVRTEHCISFYPRGHAPSIQVIMRSYASLGHVLLGFDVDSCALGYDGRRVVAAPRFVRAARLGYNLVDTTRLSPTYEIRLQKYRRRGFDVAMVEPSVAAHLAGLKVAVARGHSSLIRYSYLMGVTRLAYLLLRDLHASTRRSRRGGPPAGAQLPAPRGARSSYGYSSLQNAIASILNGDPDTPFVMGSQLRAVLFGSRSSVPSWASLTWRARRTMDQMRTRDSTLGRLKLVKTRTAARQKGEPEELEVFTGSFNPLALAWYKGGIQLPQWMAGLAYFRRDPGAAALFSGPTEEVEVAQASDPRASDDSSSSASDSGDSASDSDPGSTN